MTSPIIAPASGKRIEVRSSGVHGKGVFALVPIAKGEIIIEYTGEVISWKKAQKRHPHDPNDPNHTFYFHVSKKNVIDALHGGNDARWINHSCAPNCEADEAGGRGAHGTLRTGLRREVEELRATVEELRHELRAAPPGASAATITSASAGLNWPKPWPP